MTTAMWPATVCPSCQEDMSVELDADWRMCLRCRHEWHPSETTGPVVDAPAPILNAVETALASVPTFEPVDALAGYVEQARSRYLGARVVVHELEVEGVVDEITDDGECVVGFGSGYSVTVTPDAFSVVELSPVTDDFAIQFGTLGMSIAAQIIRAGANTLVGPDDDRRIGVPPEGFLPDDPDALLSIEHGTAYAVAILARTYGLATQDLHTLADGLLSAAEQAKATEPEADMLPAAYTEGLTDDENRTDDRIEAGEDEGAGDPGHVDRGDGAADA